MNLPRCIAIYRRYMHTSCPLRGREAVHATIYYLKNPPFCALLRQVSYIGLAALRPANPAASFCERLTRFTNSNPDGDRYFCG